MRGLRTCLVCAGSLLLLSGCRAAPPGSLTFVRGGVLAPSGSGGRPVGGGRELVERPWQPGEAIELGSLRDTAPATAECVPLFSVELGDVAALVSLGGPPPNTALAWSPDGGQLAVGSYTGELLVLDGWTGAVRQRRRLAETMIKDVAWSPDGATLYASEQSPDAYLHALDPATLESRWRRRLADELQSSPPPPDSDLYGVYTLPATFGLHVLAGGDLLVAGTHGWNDRDGVRLNRARLYRLAPDGTQRAAWPADGPGDITLLFPQVDEGSGLVAVPVGRSATGEPPPDLPVGGIQLLSLDLKPLRTFFTEPLAPHFTVAAVWEALDVGGGALLAGYNDGRARIFAVDGSGHRELALGTPVYAGDVPISASIGWGLLAGGRSVISTSTTNIPWGAQTTATRPPSPHPRANTLFVHGSDGKLQWTWRGEHELQGTSTSPDGRRVVVGAGQRNNDERRDLFGALVFRLDGDGDGQARHEAFCPTEGPVFFRQRLTDDGRVAVAETPFRAGEGVAGAYRVTVLR